MVQCPRCGGSGRITRFRHVREGMCFLCHGRGHVPPGVALATLSRLLRAKRREYRALLAKKKVAKGIHVKHLGEELATLTIEGKQLRDTWERLRSQTQV